LSYELPEFSRQALRRRGIPPDVDRVVAFIAECLHDACALVAEDTGMDRFDDKTSKGFLRWRRARNIIIERVAEDGPDGARALDIENALQVHIGDYSLSFYSARDGIAHPDLSGSSKAKQALVDEMQLQLAIPDNGGPTRLAVLYEADGLGLKTVALGVLSSAQEWHWQVTAYRRDGAAGLNAIQSDTLVHPHPSYDEQPVSDKPKLKPKSKKEKGARSDES
jgi:hypothetical protein